MTLAWHVVSIYVQTTNDRRVPALKSLLIKRGPPTVPTLNEQRLMVHSLRAHLASLAQQRATTGKPRG